MNKIEFVRKLYNGKNCYSDHMGEQELKLLHIESAIEEIISHKLSERKVIFLTGNPGDGKTFIIKAIKQSIPSDTYVETDLNTVTDYEDVANKIIDCINCNHPAIIAVNEYPFFQLLKVIKRINKGVGNRISIAQRSSIIYGAPLNQEEKQILVIDLNERNLLESKDPNKHLPLLIIEKLCNLLNSEESHNTILSYNIKALSNDYVRGKMIELIENAVVSTEHFAVRDILGALAFTLTKCLDDDGTVGLYYDSLFSGTNPLLRSIQQFDPIYLTIPELDEDLWNGEESVKKEWLFDVPSEWPNDKKYDDNPKEAVKLFKSIKRKYYFENKQSYKLSDLQQVSLDYGRKSLKDFNDKKKELKHSIIRGLNRLFFPSSSDRKHLQIWTTHKYDLSNETSTTISTKYIDANKLEIVCPEPVDWLKGMEYTPNHIVLRPKNEVSPCLVLDVEFLRILGLVENGYPSALLPSHYEQTASTFLQKLDEKGFTEDNDDDEIIIANRKSGFHMKVMIENNKYSFE